MCAITRYKAATCLLVAFLGVPIVRAAAQSQEPELIQQLTAKSPAVRRQAAEQLGPERIGELEPGLALRATLIAAHDTDSRIRERAMGGLSLLATAAANGIGTSNSSNVSDLLESRELRRTLERLVSGDPVVDVAVAASVPLMLVFGDDPGGFGAGADSVPDFRYVSYRCSQQRLARGRVSAEGSRP